MELTTQQRLQMAPAVRQVAPPCSDLPLSRPEFWPFLPPVDTIPVGIPGLAEVTGLSGLPRGHAVELVGPEQSGKTTLALRMVAGAQAAGCTVAWIDCAQHLDPHIAFAIGIHGEDLLLSHPSNAEQALGITDGLVCSDAVDLVIVDAVSALTPYIELQWPVSAQHSPGTAVVLLRAMHRLAPKVKRSRCCLMFIDQLRDRDELPFGYPETTVNTRTLTPFTSLRLQLRPRPPEPRHQRTEPRHERTGPRHHRTGDGACLLSAPKNRLGGPAGRSCAIPWLPLGGT